MHYKFSESITIFNENGASGHLLRAGETCDYVHLALTGNASIAPHALDIPVTFYVISGNGIITIDTQEYRVAGGDIVEVPPGASRSWKNYAEVELQLLAVKHKI